MENSEEDKRKNSIMYIIFIIIEIILVLAMITIFKSIITRTLISSDDYERQPRLEITGLNDIAPALSSGDKDLIQIKLLNAVQENKADIDTTIDANIRKNSIKTHYFKEEDKNFLSTIVDIPSIEQSYKVFYEYNNDEKEWVDEAHKFLIISCLNSLEEKAFDTFDCKDEYGDNIYNGVLANYIGELEFDYFSASIEGDDLSTIVITPIDLSTTETTKKHYINQTKETIESLGIFPDLFKYKVLTQADMTYRLE